MIGTDALVRAVERAQGYLGSRPDVREWEVFAAANCALLARINYTSHIPCNGVEEPKSTESHGIGLQLVFETPTGPLVGFGSEPSDLSLHGVTRAVDKARRAAVADPEFVSLPCPSAEPRALTAYHDPLLFDVRDEALVETGWKLVRGGLSAFQASTRLAALAARAPGLAALGLILGGDVTILQERMAIATSHLPGVQTDESTLLMAAVTAMVEAHAAKGSGWWTGTRLHDFTDEAAIDAVAAAIDAVDGERVPSGDYTVIFGKQPVADLLDNIVIPACTASAIYAQSSPFSGKLGSLVAAPQLTVYDHGAMPGLIGSKGITCEGLPTGRTDLIRDGVFVGCLSSWYESQRLLRDPRLAEKLGGAPAAARRALVPRNGFRFGAGGGRQFDLRPRVGPSNVIVEGSEPVPLAELIRGVEHGLYVGRIWYTYPINGLRAGDFTCTVIGDSHVIRHGRLAAPIKANTLRINDNITRILGNIVGIAKDPKGTIVWAADEVAYTPEIACAGVHVDAIAGYMEELA
jgi:predicted Zn-dependent protease